MAMPIDHLEGALADHVEHTVRSRHIADDYESIAEHPRAVLSPGRLLVKNTTAVREEPGALVASTAR